jgi:hypothetical protein
MDVPETGSNMLCKHEKILLINSPIYDTRLPWYQFLQPTVLLRLSTFYRGQGADIEFIDCLENTTNKPPQKSVLNKIEIEPGITLRKYRFGIPSYDLDQRLTALKKRGWNPDEVYVECFTTFWWEGAQEVVVNIRKVFPHAKVTLVGGYPHLAKDHALHTTGVDDVWSENNPSELNILPDLSLYSKAPTISYISLIDESQSADDVIEEILFIRKKYGRTRLFIFSDHRVASRFPKIYKSILEKVINLKERKAKYSDIRFSALGSIHPQDLIDDPSLAELMKRAGYRQLVFCDDRDIPTTRFAEDQWADMCLEAAELCHQAGFRPRTDEIISSLCLGRPGENLASRARLATLISHYAGSVIFWPYQPVPSECPTLPLEEQNGKWFPLRHSNEATYRDYLEIQGLATILNAKYRTRTFDFLGDSLIATLFQESIARQAWMPDPSVKGSLKLPVIMP